MENFLRMLNVQSVLFVYILVGIFCQKRGLLDDWVLRTHTGVKFTSMHVLRILRHEGDTGCIIIRSTRARRLTQKSENDTLLAGLVYGASCGAGMSGFLHKDRYKKRRGVTIAG